MGERAKIMLNEYTAKALLKRDDLDLDKFYSTDIKMMVKVAQQELKKKDNIIDELEKWIEEHKQYQLISERYIVWEDKLVNKLKELKEGDKE